MSAGDRRGRLSPRTPEFMPVGKFRKPVGLNGNLKVAIFTDLLELFEPGSPLFIGDRHATAQVESFTGQQSGLLKLAGGDTREQAEALRGETIYCHGERASVFLRGRFFQFQIVGLQVFTAEDECLGNVVEIIETGANDVYVVRDDGAEILIPARKEVVLEVDLEAGKMIVDLIPGLREVQQ